jgi:hypothetical protein
MTSVRSTRKPKGIPPGLDVETVGDILDRTDEDRTARMFAKALSNDPFDALARNVDDAYDEAKVWLDGTKVETQEQADALGKLYTMLDDAAKAAEQQRKAEKQPHLDAGAAVDKRYKPLVDRAETARKAVKRAVQVWNDHLAELQRIEAERVRKAAEEAAAAAAAEAAAAREANNLSAMEEAETQIANAATLADMAKRAEAAKAITKTAGERGIGTVPMKWVGRLDADVLDLDAVRAAEHSLMTHYWKSRRQWLVGLLMDEAQRDVRAGARVIPGLKIQQEKML